MPRYIDLSHAIEDEQVTYPGLPAPKIDEHLTRDASRAHYAPGTEFSIGRITMVGNTGTYLDSPYHRFADGDDLADLPLERLADLDGVVVRIAPSTERNLGPELLDRLELGGKAVLFHTSWDRHFATPAYGSGHPYLTVETAQRLVDAGAILVGIDSLNIDDTADQSRPVHTRLLEAGIPIVEHLTGLDQLPLGGFRFNAVPARVRKMGTWPVRAFAVVD